MSKGVSGGGRGGRRQPQMIHGRRQHRDDVADAGDAVDGVGGRDGLRPRRLEGDAERPLTPLVKVTGPGKKAWPSLEVNCTVPL